MKEFLFPILQAIVFVIVVGGTIVAIPIIGLIMAIAAAIFGTIFLIKDYKEYHNSK